MTLGKAYLRLADDNADYKKLEIDRQSIAQKEDGLRMPIDANGFEWWYFDAHLDNGTMVVVVFSTKQGSNANGSLAPRIEIDITTADGHSISREMTATPDYFTASKERCDVKIGKNRFEGNLNTYHIVASIDDVSVDIELVNQVGAWRPRSGHLYFGQEGRPEKLFAWLPSVPQGKVKMTYSIADESVTSAGTGYHDHNWGDTSMPVLMHDWYWARGKIGPYTIIASYITAAESYNYQPSITFLLAKDGAVVCDDETKVEFSAREVFTDEKTGKPVANMTRYTYRDGDSEYIITFQREKTIRQDIFADKLPIAERAAAKQAGMDSAYLRFSGTATLEVRQDGKILEHHQDPALWELMYFGHPRPLDI